AMPCRNQGQTTTPPSHPPHGTRPMKDAARTPHRLLLAAGLFACLAPTAAGTAAQSGPQWQPAADAGATTAQVRPTPADQSPMLPPGTRPMPLASDFEVARFEAMAQMVVANQRVPGLAMAIVHNGEVLTARGY